MLFDRDLKGDRLSEKTLCLTYDDGPGQTAGEIPGPHTLELGHYLFEQGIRAAFFVIGKHACYHRKTLIQLHEWGHIIGNHTYNHPGLVAAAQQPDDVIKEIAQRTQSFAISSRRKPYSCDPPYGNWPRETPIGSTQGRGDIESRRHPQSQWPIQALRRTRQLGYLSSRL